MELNENNEIVPSEYALNTRVAGLNIITWTLERSGPLKNGGGWCYQTLSNVIDNDGDMLEVFDILAEDVGILAFSLTGPLR